MIAVKPTNFPTIYEAFETISHDYGGGCGHSYYLVPTCIERQIDLHDIEGALRELSPEQLETFCIGETRDMEAIKNSSAELPNAYWFLKAFFNYWETDVID
jgi:hypothetical protein